MNRNRGNDGGGTERRAGSEVIYVGRSSFWVEREIDLFQEMPESPWPVMEVASASDARNEKAELESGVVAPVSAIVSGGILMGINLSGPIILQAGSDKMSDRAGFDELSRREDSNGTPLPAGELTFPRAPRVARGAFPLPLASLMMVTVVAFSLGLVVSPLGDGSVLGHSGARTTLPAHTGTAPIVAANSRPSDDRFRGTTVPLIVPTTPSRANSSTTAGRAPGAISKSDRVGLKLAIKKHVAKRPSAAVPAPARATSDSEADVVSAGDEKPSRKSVDKESIDATKTAAPGESEKSAAAKPWGPAAKPWVDPWAD